MKKAAIILIALCCHLSGWSQRDSISYEVHHLGKNVNTNGGESGAISLGDTLLLYSSIQHLGIQHNWLIDFDQNLMQVFEAPISEFGKIGKGRPSHLGFNSATHHSGNIAYDSQSESFYFTRCLGDENIVCEIYVCRKVGGIWQKPVKLPGDVNKAGTTNTMPTLGHLPDGREILYFCSDRDGGVGGLDLWYSIIENGISGSCVNLGIPVNSEADERTPFYDEADKCLYFSSDRTGGLGGMDIYRSQGFRNSWRKPTAMPAPINSSYNDLYFTIDEHNHNQGYLSSNREDSYFYQDSACCNDIYRWKRNTIRIFDTLHHTALPNELPAVSLSNVSITETQRLARSLMPIKLYFHNDEPDPKSESAITDQTYFQTYNKYMFMKRQYMDHSPINRVSDVELFFDEEIQGNCDKFEQFLKLLADDLKAGSNVSITIAGYASTSHTNSYNFNLSKRRISSIINQIMTYNKGIMASYLCSQNAGSLQISEVAYGNTQAKSAAKAPVFDIDAIQDRRIEILDYTYRGADAQKNSQLQLPLRAQHIGNFQQGETADIEVRIANNATQRATIDFISPGTPTVNITGHSQLIPGQDLVLYLHIDNRNAKRTKSKLIPISIRISGENVTQTMFLEYSVI